MTPTDLFDSESSAGESFYIAEDGQVFSISQNIPLEQDEQIPLDATGIQQIPMDTTGIEQIPLDSTEIQQIHNGGFDESGLLSDVVVGSAGIQQIISVEAGMPSLSRSVEDANSIQEIHEIELAEAHEVMETEALVEQSGLEKEVEGNMVPHLLYLTDGKEPLRHLDDFVETFTIFKCRACHFTSGQKESLYAHIEGEHLTCLQQEKELEEEEEGVVTKQASTENNDINAMLIIADVDNMKYNMENRTETVILEDVGGGRSGSSYPYFKFYLVKEQKEVFICNKCSVCMSSEDKMKNHVIGDTCVDSKCKNCGLKFNSSPEYQNHIIKCKVSIFKLQEKHALTLVTTERTQTGAGEEEGQETSALVDQYYKKISEEEEGDEEEEDEVLFGEEYKYAKLTRNRTDLETDGDKRVWVCSIRNCYSIFKEETVLDYHRTCHVEDSLVCLECQRSFTRWSDLSLHLFKEHNRDYDLYKCVQCLQYKAPSVSALEKHCQTHENLRLYQCDICFKTFNQYVQLKNHSVMHLKQARPLVDLPNWAKPKACEICQKVCSDSKSLKKHVQAVHSKLKPYICQICGYKSHRKGNLRMHVRQHSGDKPFQCDECEYRTGDHNSLRRHKMRHSGVKPYQCVLCDYSSIQSTNYKAHLKFKHHISPDGQPVVVKERRKKSVNLKARAPASAPEKPPRELTMSHKPDRDLSLPDLPDSLLALAGRSGFNFTHDTS